MDTYRAVAAHAAAEIKRKGSRFIAEAFPAQTAEAAEEQIAAVRRREHKATHHCTAYRAGAEGETFRYDDDGEPSGTAGPPILSQIDGRGLTNTLVVVTRYYGGTKLGTGGLARAYGGAAAEVLDAAPVKTHVRRVLLRLRFAYDDTSPAMRVLDQFDTEIRAQHYTTDTELVVAVRRSEAGRFREAFRNALGGRGVVKGGEGEWEKGWE